MRKLTLLLVSFFVFAGTLLAQRTITGKVTDDKGNPLSNVSVVAKGTTTGTTTKADGSYSLIVPAKSKMLVFSSVNMESIEIEIGQRTNIFVSMKTLAKELDNVIIVGYGSGKKVEDVAGTLTKLDGAVIHDRPTANMNDALQGRVSGLQVYTSSGEPSASSSVRLHGVGSLGASNTPLYVLDGVPVDPGTIVSLNPNDIESITVLKDPSTTAIYGSRASNGVLLYTTKQGKATRPRFTVSAQYGVSNLIETTKDLFNSFMNTKQLTDFWIATGYRTQAQVNTLLAQYPFDTKWYKAYYQENVPTYQLNMNLSGGGGKTTYYISGGYFKQEGLAYRSDFKRYTFRSNVTSTLNSWLKFGLNLGGGIDERQTNPYGSNSTNRGLSLLAQPFYSPVDANGVEYPDLIPGWGRYHPRYLANKNQSVGKNVQFNPTAFMEISPVKNLILRTQAGMDAYDYTASSVRLPSYLGSLNNGSASESFTRGSMSTITNTIEYKFKIGEEHGITVLAGQEYIKSVTTAFNASSNGQTDDRLTLISAGPNNRDAGSSKSEFAYQSYFGRVNYKWREKYFVDLSVRQDQSSRFGKDNRTANFWSAGVLWKAKREAFLSDVKWLTDLAIRASYGTSGNSSIGNYDNLATVGTGQYDGQTSFGISAAGNPLLGWEKQKQTTFGVDVILFKKIDLKTAYYVRETSDQLFDVPFPYTSGFSDIQDNVGSIRNSGIDVELSVDVLNKPGAFIKPFVSFNYNKMKVTELFQGRNYWVIPNTGVSYVVGQPVTFLYPIWAGVNPQNGDPQWYLPDPDPEKFINTTKDPNRLTSTFNTAALQQSTGINRYAPFNGGFGVDAGYKGFYLNANFSFSQGKYLINNDAFFFENPTQFPGFNQSINILDYWKQPGDVTAFPRYQTGLRFREFDSRLIQNASFMRLKGLTLGYSFPQSVLDRMKVVKGINFSITGRNLWTVTNYAGPDPEVDSNVSLGANPNTKQIVVGLQIDF